MAYSPLRERPQSLWPAIANRMSQYPIRSKSQNCLWSWKCPHFYLQCWTTHRLDWWCLQFSWEKVGKRLDSVGLSQSCRNIWEMIAKFPGEIIYSHKDNLYIITGHLGRSRIYDWFFLPHPSEGIEYVLEDSFDAGWGDSFEEEVVSTSVQLLVQ